MKLQSVTLAHWAIFNPIGKCLLPEKEWFNAALFRLGQKVDSVQLEIVTTQYSIKGSLSNTRLHFSDFFSPSLPPFSMKYIYRLVCAPKKVDIALSKCITRGTFFIYFFVCIWTRERNQHIHLLSELFSILESFSTLFYISYLPNEAESIEYWIFIYKSN